jgi:hypothetical protein
MDDLRRLMRQQHGKRTNNCGMCIIQLAKFFRKGLVSTTCLEGRERVDSVSVDHDCSITPSRIIEDPLDTFHFPKPVSN